MSIRINSLLFVFILMSGLLWAAAPKEVSLVKKVSKAWERKYGKSKTLSIFLRHNIEATKNKLFSNVFSRRDTLFLINQYGPVSGKTYCMAWNKYDTVSYISESNLTVSKDKIYNNNALTVISQWDTVTFSQLAKRPTFDIGPMFIARVVFFESSCRVDCYSIYQQGDWQ